MEQLIDIINSPFTIGEGVDIRDIQLSFVKKFFEDFKSNYSEVRFSQNNGHIYMDIVTPEGIKMYKI